MKIVIIICLISLSSCYKNKTISVAQKQPCDPSKFSENWQVDYIDGYPVAYKNTCNGTIYMHKQKTGSMFTFKESKF